MEEFAYSLWISMKRALNYDPFVTPMSTGLGDG
jgi:hypothetical protein